MSDNNVIDLGSRFKEREKPRVREVSPSAATGALLNILNIIDQDEMSYRYVSISGKLLVEIEQVDKEQAFTNLADQFIGSDAATICQAIESTLSSTGEPSKEAVERTWLLVTILNRFLTQLTHLDVNVTIGEHIDTSSYNGQMHYMPVLIIQTPVSTQRWCFRFI